MNWTLIVIRAVLVVSALWIIGDGAGSIIVYWSQSWYEHLVRILRIFVGCVVLVIALSSFLPSWIKRARWPDVKDA